MLKGYKSKIFLVLQIIIGIGLALEIIDFETFKLLSTIFLPGLGFGLVDKIGRD
jgi:hypothetical protein